MALLPNAIAAQPNNQACLGEDISTYAHWFQGIGEIVSFLSHSPNGFGNEVQAHLAGLVPDEFIPNSCNDE